MSLLKLKRAVAIALVSVVCAPLAHAQERFTDKINKAVERVLENGLEPLPEREPGKDVNQKRFKGKATIDGNVGTLGNDRSHLPGLKPTAAWGASATLERPAGALGGQSFSGEVSQEKSGHGSEKRMTAQALLFALKNRKTGRVDEFGVSATNEKNHYIEVTEGGIVWRSGVRDEDGEFQGFAHTFGASVGQASLPGVEGRRLSIGIKHQADLSLFADAIKLATDVGIRLIDSNEEEGIPYLDWAVQTHGGVEAVFTGDRWKWLPDWLDVGGGVDMYSVSPGEDRQLVRGASTKVTLSAHPAKLFGGGK